MKFEKWCYILILFIQKVVEKMSPHQKRPHLKHASAEVDQLSSLPAFKSSNAGGAQTVTSNQNHHLNIIEIFNNLFLKINIIKMQNLVLALTWKKGNFKFFKHATSPSKHKKIAKFFVF